MFKDGRGFIRRSREANRGRPRANLAQTVLRMDRDRSVNLEIVTGFFSRPGACNNK